MHTGLSAIAFAVSVTFAAASPAGRDAVELRRNHGINRRGEMIETSDLIIPRHPQNSIINVAPSLDGGNGTGAQIGDNTFKVPNTNTTLIISIGGIVSPKAELNLINATSIFIAKQLAASGDGQLPQNVDPFYYDLEQGVYLNCNSTEGQHLTWGLLQTTIGFLTIHLSGYAQYRTHVGFNIWEDPWGLVGRGYIGAGYSGVPLPTVVAGSAGITQYY